MSCACSARDCLLQATRAVRERRGAEGEASAPLSVKERRAEALAAGSRRGAVGW